MKKLTWNELADLYDKHHSGRPARTLPMETVANWAVARPEEFFVDEEDTICLRQEEPTFLHPSDTEIILPYLIKGIKQQ